MERAVECLACRGAEGAFCWQRAPRTSLTRTKELRLSGGSFDRSWGRFAVDLASRIGQARRNLREGQAGGSPLLGSLSTDELAKFVKVTRALAVLFSRQNKTFFGLKGVRGLWPAECAFEFPNPKKTVSVSTSRHRRKGPSVVADSGL